MAGPVVFNYAAFVARYPEFAGISEPQAQGFFDEASVYCANETSNPIFATAGLSLLTTLLNMLTAHVAWLNAPRDANGNPAAAGQPASAIVGRINSASQGSVSVQADAGEANAASPSEWWYKQTRYGSAYWAATAAYRTFLYAAQPTIVAEGAYPSNPFPFGRFARRF